MVPLPPSGLVSVVAVTVGAVPEVVNLIQAALVKSCDWLIRFC